MYSKRIGKLFLLLLRARELICFCRVQDKIAGTSSFPHKMLAKKKVGEEIQNNHGKVQANNKNVILRSSYQLNVTHERVWPFPVL